MRYVENVSSVPQGATLPPNKYFNIGISEMLVYGPLYFSSKSWGGVSVRYSYFNNPVLPNKKLKFFL